MMAGFEFDRQDLLPERLASYFRQQILSGTFAPGRRLIEQDLAKSTNVSRVPLREALRILASEGFITLSPYKGASVNRHSEAELRELFGTRSALEQYAARRVAVDGPAEAPDVLRQLIVSMRKAVKARDWSAYNQSALKFHQELIGFSDNKVLMDTYNRIRVRFSRYQSILSHTPISARASVVEHARMVDAISQGDGNLAAEETEMHMLNLVKRFHEAITGLVGSSQG